jgi:uncharacterized protein
MIIIHEVNSDTDFQDRLLVAPLRDHLRIMPAVVLTGARQTGKSTLAARLAGETRRYLTLDDLEIRGRAQDAPAALLQVDGRLTLDEVQRAPDLLLAIKQDIDRRRVPGRFLLTGSANLLLMQRISESLAGRATYLTMWPMTRREQLGQGTAGRWSDLFAAPDAEWRDLLGDAPATRERWQDFAQRGGFPTPALHLSSATDRSRWFEGYVQTYLERDLQSLAAIAALPDFRRLMRIAALRIGRMINQTEMGRDAMLAQATAHRYLNLLETSYMIVRVPAFATNRTKRLIKTPKLYWSDVGLGWHLSAEPEPTGAHLENLVLHDLLAWREMLPRRAEIMYWRTTNGEEVDFVVESANQLLPIEVKATTRPSVRDTANIRVFRHEYGAAARPGLLLHAGEHTEWLTADVLAVPWWRVI